MDFLNEFKTLLSDALSETGASLQGDLHEVALYANERAAHLSTLVGQAGFEHAVRAERDNVMLKAAVVATEQADAVDQRIVGLVQGALAIGAKALAA